MLNNYKVSKDQKSFPEPSLRRLPLYYRYIKELEKQGEENVSCTQIAYRLNILPIQVRKDLEITEVVGKPKVGYKINEILPAIEKFFGWNNVTDAFIVGAGNLGVALMGYKGFKDCGINIVAAFDVDESKKGKTVEGTKIFDFNLFSDLVKRLKINIGILTVPASSAQSVADLMVDSGIKAIWNFAPVHIHVNDGVIVQHENLASSLAVLSKKLNLNLSKEKI